MKNRSNPDELVELLDQMFSNGTEKVSVKIESNDGDFNVKTIKSSDCEKNSACAQPTENIEETD